MIANSMTSSNGDLDYKSYSYRWVILTIFCLLDLCNAILFVTFAPISNISQNYFGGGDYGTSSAVNMLATMFLILYPVGTVIGIVFMKYYRLRNTLIFAGAINAFGALLRLLAAIYREELGDSGCYCVMLLGQSIAALAYPMYVNLPAAIASTWFPVNERDMSTTIGALFNPIGNAAGQVIPAFIVYQKSQSPSGDDDGAKVYGMVTLMAVELVICAVPLALAVLFFRDAPPTPPSHSTNLKLETVKRHQLNLTRSSSQEGGDETLFAWRAVLKESVEMFRNRDFVILFVAFSINFGILNALLTVFNQLLSPHGYSNGDSGTVAAICIVTGLVGSALAGYLMEKTQAYRRILKTGAFVCFWAAILFMCMLYKDNFWPLLISAAILGFFALPLLPVMMENCVECTYPLPEELSIGILHNGANVLAVFFVFITQALLEEDGGVPAPLLPSNFFIAGVILISCVLLLYYNGQYKRLQNDVNTMQEPLLSGSTDFGTDSVSVN